MQKKIGSILDEDLIKKAKLEAVAEHTTLNHILEKALADYLFRNAGGKQKLSAVEISFGVMKLPAKVVQKIAQEGIYEAE